jgi:hypothetical protein
MAELIGNEGPVLLRKSVLNSQCSVGNSLSPRFLCCSAPRTCGESGMHANESTPLGYSLKLPAQPAETRTSKAGSRGDKCRECSWLPVLWTKSQRRHLMRREQLGAWCT